jgi:hypothetical protein
MPPFSASQLAGAADPSGKVANSAGLFGGLDSNLVEILNKAGECGIAQR